MSFLKAAQFKARSDSFSSSDSYILTAYNANIQFSLACNKEHRKKDKINTFSVVSLFQL